MKRQLYQCSMARVNPMRRIYCAAGHKLSNQLRIKDMAAGASLVLIECQDCGDFDEMGPPLIRRDRGWFGFRLSEGN